MGCNVGTTDKIVRYGIAAVAFIAGINFASGLLAYVLFAVAGIMVLTSLISFCPIYRVLGLSTCSIERKAERAQAS